MQLPEHPLLLESQAEWRLWLEAYHADETEAWLVVRKQHAPQPGVTYEEAVEEALCFGWIDGAMRPHDTETYYLRFSPRKARSIWSVSNQQRVARLLAQGRMAEAGLAQVRAAQANGEWDAAIRREDTSMLPEDLAAALAENPAAQANFEGYPASQKKQFLYWILSAKTEATRQKRIHKTVAMAENNERIR